MRIAETCLKVLDFINAGLFVEAEAELQNVKEFDNRDFAVDIGHILCDRILRGNASGSETLLSRLLRTCSFVKSFDLCSKLVENGASLGFIGVILQFLLDNEAQVVENKYVMDTLMFEWPFNLEEQLTSALEDESSTSEVVRYAALLLQLYNIHPNFKTIGFERLIDKVFLVERPDCPDIDTFALALSFRRPFHRHLILHKDGIMVPSVYSGSYICNQLCDVIIELASENSEERTPTLANQLDLIAEKIVTFYCYTEFESLDTTKNIIASLLPFVEDFELGEKRISIMKKCEKLIDIVPVEQRVLLIKRLSEEVKQSSKLQAQSFVLAWLVDFYRKNLKEQCFKDELGTFWMLLEKLKYEDISLASSYYVSLMNLAQMQALIRYNAPLLNEVNNRIILGISEQLSDWKQLSQFRDDTAVLSVPQSDNVDLIIYNIEFTRQSINNFVYQN